MKPARAKDPMSENKRLNDVAAANPKFDPPIKDGASSSAFRSGEPISLNDSPTPPQASELFSARYDRYLVDSTPLREDEHTSMLSNIALINNLLFFDDHSAQAVLRTKFSDVCDMHSLIEKLEYMDRRKYGLEALSKLRLIREIHLRLQQVHAENRAIFSSWPDLVEYCRSRIGHKKHEIVELFMMDSKMRFCGAITISEGDAESVKFDRREIVAEAIANGSSNVVIIHNHPSEVITPSQQDISETQILAHAFSLADINFIDHIIISRSGEFSFAGNGLIKI